MAAAGLLLGIVFFATALPAHANPLESARWDPHVGAVIPGDLVFTDEANHPITLADTWRTRPVLLALVYYTCPNLCDTVLNGLTHGLLDVPLTTGRDFDLVAVSIDPADTPAIAARKRHTYLTRYGRPGADAGWHFLVGSPQAVARLAAAVGYGYACDGPSHQFSHPAGLVAVSPGGRISGYIKGIEFEPAALTGAIHDAADGRAGSIVGALLRCFHYSPLVGKYGPTVMRLIQVAGAATVTALVALVCGLVWRERHAAPPPREEAPR